MTTNTEREELAKLISSRHTMAAVDALLAAGYRKPRTITTVEELDALPNGSVVLDRNGLSLHKNMFSQWDASNGTRNVQPDELEADAFPATVLHTPEPTR